MSECRSIRKNLDYYNNMLKQSNSSVTILDYEKHPNIVKCYCNVCNQTFLKDKFNVSAHKGCPVCAGRKVVVGYNNLSFVRPDLEKYLVDKTDGERYTSRSNKYILCKCPTCDYHKTIKINGLFYRGFACPYCDDNNTLLAVGKNDIATKEPWMIEYLKDPSDAYKYRAYSGKKIKFQCPVCKTEYEKSINLVGEYGFVCHKCSDGISYPNKFARALLEQLPVVNTEYEFSRDWTNKKKYDNYFEYEDKKYFLEMDGGFHYKDSNITSLKHNQENDKEKDRIALENNIIMIRIDCREPNKDYITNSIQHSLLSTIFDLSQIDWNECDLQSHKNIFYEVCKEYNLNQLKLIDIAAKFKVSYSTVKTYLRRGREIGIVDTSELSTVRAYRIDKRNAKNIGAIYDKNNNLIFEFIDFVEAAKQLQQYDTSLKHVAYDSLWWTAKTSKSHCYKKKYYIRLY